MSESPAPILGGPGLQVATTPGLGGIEAGAPGMLGKHYTS